MEQTASCPEWKSEYSNMSKEEFKSLILMGKKSRYEILYFILNTLLQIFYDSDWYYYCEHFKNNSKCKICTIPLIFSNFEEDIKKNMFNVNF